MNALVNYQIISIILFSLGVYVCLTRRNAVRFLMGIELILNAAGLNFIAYSRFIEGGINGQVAAVFVIIIAAAEAAVALAILLNIFRHLQDVNIDDATGLSDYRIAPEGLADAAQGRNLK
jgi:NADH-quinone oxidoreductase subunit K